MPKKVGTAQPVSVLGQQATMKPLPVLLCFGLTSALLLASGTGFAHQEPQAMRPDPNQAPELTGGPWLNTEDGKPAKLRHVVLQSSIRVEGDRAWGRTLWLEMANHGPGDEPKIGTYGIYEDEFTKASGRWLIAKRRVLNEFIPNRNSGPGNPVSDMDRAAEALRAGR